MAATKSRGSGCRRRWTRTPAWPSSATGPRPAPARPRSRLDRPPPRAYLADLDSPDVIQPLRALADSIHWPAERTRRLAEENRSLRLKPARTSTRFELYIQIRIYFVIFCL